ncbi:hypothetical protein WJX73_002303 [Symbiochloris irregularis]|uniref:Transmembrane protein n=1 Tax=Symbiochloris irregularis TaxID=706552 RepID=A0AAW1NYH9_9CHLO
MLETRLFLTPCATAHFLVTMAFRGYVLSASLIVWLGLAQGTEAFPVLGNGSRHHTHSSRMLLQSDTLPTPQQVAAAAEATAAAAVGAADFNASQSPAPVDTAASNLVPAVQWTVSVPGGNPAAWSSSQTAYLHNVASAAGVAPQWVTILQAPNTSFTVTTQIAYDSGEDTALAAELLATELSSNTSSVLAPLQHLGPIVVENVLNTQVAAYNGVESVASPQFGVTMTGSGMSARLTKPASAEPPFKLVTPLFAVAGFALLTVSTLLAAVAWRLRKERAIMPYVGLPARSSSGSVSTRSLSASSEGHEPHVQPNVSRHASSQSDQQSQQV